MAFSVAAYLTSVAALLIAVHVGVPDSRAVPPASAPVTASLVSDRNVDGAIAVLQEDLHRHEVMLARLRRQVYGLQEYRDNLVGGVRQLMERVNRLEACLRNNAYTRDLLGQCLADYTEAGRR